MKVAINGFGRIGRCVLRVCLERGIEVSGINDRADISTLSHLYQYDSTFGVKKNISHTKNSLIANNIEIPFYNELDIEKLSWNCDVVLECTGVFKKRFDLEKFLLNAKKVIVSAPVEGVDIMVVMGINHNKVTQDHKILSNSSCTTNCLSPIVKILNDNFNIESGFMTTVHSYTNDQKILDSPHKDLRRARAAALSIIPTSTGATKALCKVIPKLEGKISGIAIRVPTPNVSLVDFVANLEKEVTTKTVNDLFIKESKDNKMFGVEQNPLVSVDFLGRQESSIIDLSSTMVIGKTVKVISWYDNECGFSNRMVDLAEHITSNN